jgi:predicted AAA+ superfamily ATPase
MLLVRAGLLHLVHHTEGSTGIPLGGEVDLRDFKVIFVDVGLAQALLGGHLGALANHWIMKGDLSANHVGNLAEVFVGQELIASTDPFEQPRIFYWRRNAKNSSAEIDYLVQHAGSILPIEVKSGATGRLKSLKMFLQLRPQCKVGYRIFEHDFSLREGIQSVPLYAVWRLFS